MHFDKHLQTEFPQKCSGNVASTASNGVQFRWVFSVASSMRESDGVRGDSIKVFTSCVGARTVVLGNQFAAFCGFPCASSETPSEDVRLALSPSSGIATDLVTAIVSSVLRSPERFHVVRTSLAVYYTVSSILQYENSMVAP